MIQSFRDEFARYRAIGEKALRQIPDDRLNHILSPDGNSPAMIVRHINGNLLSRFTDFLTTDGEKPWRDRDGEFETRAYTPAEVEQLWKDAWDRLESELNTITDEDLSREVSIRGIPMTAHESLMRALAHISSHVGQIVLLARILTDAEWEWISIPKGESVAYNVNPTKEKRP